MTSASAPGKVIISGEHSVVYKQPALAGALNLRCNVNIADGDAGIKFIAKDLDKELHYDPENLRAVSDNKEIHFGFDNLAGAVLAVQHDISGINYTIEISSTVPIGAGLGSSAATSVAIVAALREHLGLDFDKNSISEAAFLAEKIAHGTPSGIDNTTATLGGLVHFQAGTSESLELNDEIPLIIVNTNIPRNTKTLVNYVRDRKEIVGGFMDQLFEKMGELTMKIEECLIDNDLELAGHLFDINQGMLDAIGVNHPKLSELIQLARDSGAKGAKLTGAGGGGCFIILSDIENKDYIKNQLTLPGIDVYDTSISPRGVEIL